MTAHEGTVAKTITRRLGAERIAAQIDNLKPLPSIAVDAMKLVDDPNSDSDSIEKKLSADPVITARLFKLANSAFFSKGTPSKTVSQAITRLGLKSVRNIILCACAGDVMAQPLANYPYDGFGAWTHAMTVALTAPILNEKTGGPPARGDELFLAGLLHDCGKMITDSLMEGRCAAVGQHGLAAEMHLCGTSHPEVGLMIADKWNLPDYVRACIRDHHNDNFELEFKEQIALIALANFFVNSKSVGLLPDSRCDEAFNSAALDALVLSPDSFSEICLELDEQFPEIVNLAGQFL